MKCIKCRGLLDSGYFHNLALCSKCERDYGENFIMDTPSEILELHINSYKELSHLPKDIKLSDTARQWVKKEIDNMKHNRDYTESITNMIYGFCRGYYCHMTEK